jgi:hypothetical protein
MTPSSQAVAITAASPAAATRTSGPAAKGLRRIARGDTKTLTGTIPASSNGGIDYCPLRSVDESETEDSEDGRGQFRVRGPDFAINSSADLKLSQETDGSTGYSSRRDRCEYPS